MSVCGESKYAERKTAEASIDFGERLDPGGRIDGLRVSRGCHLGVGGPGHKGRRQGGGLMRREEEQRMGGALGRAAWLPSESALTGVNVRGLSWASSRSRPGLPLRLKFEEKF